MSRREHDQLDSEVFPGAVPNHAVTLAEDNIVRVVEQNHSAELMQLLIDVGTSRMATATESFSAIVRISKDASIKESKAYKSLKGNFSATGGKMNGTWEEYCSMTGRSVDVVDRGIANLKAFGAEALENMMLIGFTRSEMNQYRRLPNDERSALIDAAKAGNKDDLLDLAETLSAKHLKEKETLESRATEAEETAEARSEVIAKKESRINALEEDLHKSRRRLESQTPDEVGEQLRQETAGIGWSIVGRLNVDLAKAFAALDVHARAADCTHDAATRARTGRARTTPPRRLTPTPRRRASASSRNTVTTRCRSFPVRIRLGTPDNNNARGRYGDHRHGATDGNHASNAHTAPRGENRLHPPGGGKDRRELRDAVPQAA